MKNVVRLACAVALCALAFTLFAGQQPKKEQIKPELFFIIQEHVKPGMHKEYEAATRDLVASLNQYKIDNEKVNFETVSGPEFGYIYVIPLENFADMDAIHDSWMQAVDTIGADRWEDMEEAMTKTMASKNVFHVARHAELSYKPAKPAVPSEEIRFLNYEFFYITPGSEKKFEALAGKFRDLYAKHNINQGFSFFQKITGEDLPVYVVVEGARSEAEFLKNYESIHATLGKEFDALLTEAMTYTRRYEKMSGTPRPDLSYPNLEKGVSTTRN